MDIEMIFSLIGSVGFPIVACVALFKLFNDMQKTLSDLNVSLSIMNERLSDIENKINNKEKEI